MKKPNSEANHYRLFSRVWLVVSLALGSLLLVQAIAWAQPELNSWRDGDTLTAEDLNANFDALRAQMLTSGNFKVIKATLTPGVVDTAGTGPSVRCGEGFALLSYGLTQVWHTQDDTPVEGWNLGGNYGCSGGAESLQAYLWNYDFAGETPNTRIECTGLCVRVQAP